MNIPRLAHFVWLGSSPPDWVRDNIRIFTELNPDFIVALHTDATTLLPCLKPAYDRIKEDDHPWSWRSDLLRISILLRFGGFYFDTDFLFIRSLSEVYRDQGDFPRECFLTQCDWMMERHAVGRDPRKTRRWIANGVIGTTPDSPFLACVLRGILLGDLDERRGWGVFGTILFTELAERFPGIAHVNAMDNWYRIQPRENSMAAYRRIRTAGYTQESISRELGKALPYAMHMAMEEQTEL